MSANLGIKDSIRKLCWLIHLCYLCHGTEKESPMRKTIASFIWPLPNWFIIISNALRLKIPIIFWRMYFIYELIRRRKEAYLGIIQLYLLQGENWFSTVYLLRIPRSSSYCFKSYSFHLNSRAKCDGSNSSGWHDKSWSRKGQIYPLLLWSC